MDNLKILGPNFVQQKNSIYKKILHPTVEVVESLKTTGHEVIEINP